jgi:hypothetical protein
MLGKQFRGDVDETGLGLHPVARSSIERLAQSTSDVLPLLLPLLLPDKVILYLQKSLLLFPQTLQPSPPDTDNCSLQIQSKLVLLKAVR